MEQPQQAPRTGEQLTRLLFLAEKNAEYIKVNSENIKAIDGKQDDINLEITTFLTEYKATCKAVDTMHLDIYGNGKAGIKDDVSHLKSHDKLIRWIGGIVVGALVLSSVSLWMFLLVKFGSEALTH